MRRLMLLRHAKSDRPPGIADHDRPLNRRGRDEAPLVGTYLAHNGLVPDRVLCSTSERTRETWELVAGSLADAVPPASPSAAAPNAPHAKPAGKKRGRSDLAWRRSMRRRIGPLRLEGAAQTGLL